MSQLSYLMDAASRLRHYGYAVIIWTPEEMEGKDITQKDLEDRSIELGNIMIEDADDVELLNEALDEFAGDVFTIPEIDIGLDEAQYIHLSDMIGAASKLVGDGVGGELSVNCEYERGMVELICDLAGLSVEYRDQVRDAIHASARAQAVPRANA